MIITLENIFAQCTPIPECGCWLWTGGVAGKGYGAVYDTVARKVKMTHRAMAEFLGWPIKGLLVCHKCDTPACCNPDHFFIGTHSDNSRDASRKGRIHRPYLGVDHCQFGHPLKMQSYGKRLCLTCHAARQRKMRLIKRTRESD